MFIRVSLVSQRGMSGQAFCRECCGTWHFVGLLCGECELGSADSGLGHAVSVHFREL